MALNHQWEPQAEPALGKRRLHLRDVESVESGVAYDGVGADLRAARVRAGKKLDDVARDLRIGLAHLESIEEGRFGDLPGAVYGLGFVRSYAEHLGLDAAAAVAGFKDETDPYAARTKLVFPLPSTAGRSPGGRLILVSLMLVAAVFAGWYAISERERMSVELVPEVPDNLLGPALETPTPPGGDSAAAVTDLAPSGATENEGGADEAVGPYGTSRAVAGETAAMSPAGETITLAAAVEPPLNDDAPPALPDRASAVAPEAAPEVARVEAAPARPLESQAAVLAPAAEAVALARAADYVPQVYGAANTTARIVVIAHADSWVQIRGPDDELLLTRVMRSGDRYRVPNRSDLTMLTGNAGALEIVVDGTPIAPIGEAGAVRRDISLDADRFLAGNTARP